MLFRSWKLEEEVLEEWLPETVAELEAEIDSYRAAAVRDGGEPIGEVGDIFMASWGYDQSNLDWYQIIEMKGQTATLCRIMCEIVAHDHVVPRQHHFVPDAAPHHATCGGEQRVHLQTGRRTTSESASGPPGSTPLQTRAGGGGAHVLARGDEHG